VICCGLKPRISLSSIIHLPTLLSVPCTLTNFVSTFVVPSKTLNASLYGAFMPNFSNIRLILPAFTVLAAFKPSKALSKYFNIFNSGIKAIKVNPAAKALLYEFPSKSFPE